MMLLVADVHGAWARLRRVAAGGCPILVLGDLPNLIDYRTMDGLLVEVFGKGVVAEASHLRWSGDYEGARRVWRAATRGRGKEISARLGSLLREEYLAAAAALAGAEAYATYGNVDDPVLMAEVMGSAGIRFVDGEAVEIGGLRVGFAGGGIGPDPGAPGIVTEDEMGDKLSRIGAVDILCTHVAPAVGPLGYDVVAGSSKHSVAVLEYLMDQRPPFHYFGDVHQPQATAWRVGFTRCRNVGFFRSTGRAVRHG